MAIEILRPNGAGDETNISSLVGAATNWEAVDDVTPDEGNTRINPSTSKERDLYTIESSSIGIGTINKITIYFYITTVNQYGSCNSWAAIKPSDTVYESDLISIFYADAWHYESWEWVTNPDTSLAWTWDDIAALQIGIAAQSVETKGTCVPYITQVYVEIDYQGPEIYSINSSSSLTTSDSIQKQGTLNKSISSTSSFTDNILKQITKNLILSDNLSFSDDFTKKFVFARTFSSSMTLSDSFAKHLLKNLNISTTLNLSDSQIINTILQVPTPYWTFVLTDIT